MKTSATFNRREHHQQQRLGPQELPSEVELLLLFGMFDRVLPLLL